MNYSLTQNNWQLLLLCTTTDRNIAHFGLYACLHRNTIFNQGDWIHLFVHTSPMSESDLKKMRLVRSDLAEDKCDVTKYLHIQQVTSNNYKSSTCKIQYFKVKWYEYLACISYS